jgi:hypothetical protein
MKLTIPIVLACLALCGGSALAAQITWGDDNCKNTITFDAAQVDEEALRNTVNLLFASSDIRLPATPVFLFTPQQAARADLSALQRECAEIAHKGSNLKLLPLPGIEEYRTTLLDDARDVCELKSVKIRGVKDAAALRDYAPAAQACSSFIDALEGKSDFDRAWRDTVEASCQRNAQPAVCRNRRFGDAQRPDGPERQRLFVLGFGWNNCAVRFMRINIPNARRTALGKALVDEFKRRFEIVKSDCDFETTD